MFHHFHGGAHARSQGSIDAEGLADIIGYARSRWRLMPASDWAARARTRTLDERDVCLTFDDNLKCQYDIALPVLKQFDLTGFWFVYTSPLAGVLESLEVYRHFRHSSFSSMDEFYAAFFDIAVDDRRVIETDEASNYLKCYSFYTLDDRRYRWLRDKYLKREEFASRMRALMDAREYAPELIAPFLWMNSGDLIALKESGHIIGLHSHTHPTRLDLLSPEMQRSEYVINSSYLAQILGETATTMSHPCNAFSEHSVATLRDLGVTLGFRGDMEEPILDGLDYRRLEHTFVPRIRL